MTVMHVVHLSHLVKWVWQDIKKGLKVNNDALSIVLF